MGHILKKLERIQNLPVLRDILGNSMAMEINLPQPFLGG